jgi:phage terminase large subunit
VASIEERLELLSKAEHDKGLQRDLITLCKMDFVFWCDHFCWTFNPRKKPYHFPFNLHPFQKQMARALIFCIEEGKEGRDGNCLIEKSRDLGGTWVIEMVYEHYFIFEEGSDFHMGSKMRDDVDKKGVKSTLFGKLRYSLDMLPVWMMPKLGRKNDSLLKLVHPENGNSITGQSATPDFGRSGRYKSALLDEYARHPYDQQAYESITESTESTFLLYTPYGKANHAYRLASQDDLTCVPLQAEETEEEKERTLLIYPPQKCIA